MASDRRRRRRRPPPSPAAPESPIEAPDGGDHDAAGRGNGKAVEAGSENGVREYPKGWGRLHDKQAADKRTLEEAYQPDEGQMTEDPKEQDEAKGPQVGQLTAADAQERDQSTSSGQQIGGIVY